MSSGYGNNGGRGRCYPFWQEFNKCYVQAEGPKECLDLQDDYFECLSRAREIKRTKIINEFGRMRKKAEAEAAAKKEATSS
ncbi:MAG: hypothetical protein DHS80DRAFT_32529 [Piptocephalis tieghemiana]|nr:MAG: hypothetical protein DHS80DRAFT_32529 [Piptocephalis tieghemiana]